MMQVAPCQHARPIAVPAVCRIGAQVEIHQTVAITALGLRVLRRSGQGQSACASHHADFLERAMTPAGTFGFWPAGDRPAWTMAIPDDVDDTALALLELHLAGRLTRQRAVRIMATNILPCRVRHGHEIRPAWIVPGAFETWIESPPAGSTNIPRAGGINMVDCVVNANVAALMAALGMVSAPGLHEAVASITAGLAWAGHNRLRLRSLTPFYPHPYELRSAVENAVACGCPGLADAVQRLADLAPALPAPDEPVCSAAYRADGWVSPALHALRQNQQTGSS